MHCSDSIPHGQRGPVSGPIAGPTSGVTPGPARVRAQAALAALACLMPPALAQPAGHCTALADDAARLACYDRLHGRSTVPAATRPADTAPRAAAATPTTPTTPTAVNRHTGSLLAERWDLDNTGIADFAPRPYHPVYLLPATWTAGVNRRPSSPSEGHSVNEDQPLKAIEAKYQISLKARLGHRVLGTPISLWGGYTQSSRWQVYNGAISRPFRETNYEPELIAVMPLRTELLGGQLRLASLALNHQSNGRSLPLSRSWNRVIGTLAFERGPWVAELRPWLRIPERTEDDDNPDIQDHIGRGELRLGHYGGDHALTLQLRHSLRSGARSHGSVQLDWVFPLDGVLHGYLQLFTGHGESLVDYNRHQTKAGLGVTIAGWR